MICYIVQEVYFDFDNLFSFWELKMILCSRKSGKVTSSKFEWFVRYTTIPSFVAWVILYVAPENAWLQIKLFK